ncbi:winged helix-turn-helix domain-containing protein, partial [Acinetobacter baumannii]
SELLARVRVALRHASRLASGQEESTFSFGDVTVDFAKRNVLMGGVEVHLTRIEYKLLNTLIKHAGKVVTHNQLLREIWGMEYSEESN